MAQREENSVELKAAVAIHHIDGHMDDKHDNIDGHKDGKHGHVEGNALLVNKDGEVRKIPVPSSDPNDPLNFRRWEKYGVVLCCCWFSIMGLSVASGLGAILNVFFEMYTPQGYSADQVVLLITLPTLCIGLGKSCILRPRRYFTVADRLSKATTSSSPWRSPLGAGPSFSCPW
jgi:hypothetical protein